MPSATASDIQNTIRISSSAHLGTSPATPGISVDARATTHSTSSTHNNPTRLHHTDRAIASVFARQDATPLECDASSSAKRDWSRFVHKTAADVYDALSTRRFEQAQLQQAFGFEEFKFVTALTVVLATDKIDAQT